MIYVANCTDIYVRLSALKGLFGHKNKVLAARQRQVLPASERLIKKKNLGRARNIFLPK
jgi:hypothetical protein